MGTDSELLSAIRSGSDKAFSTLYQRHSEWVLRYAHRRSHDADDIVSDLWMRVLSRPPVDVSDFRAWASVCVRREAWRRSDRGTVATLQESQQPAGTSSPTRMVARREALGLLEDARERGDLSTVEVVAVLLDMEGWQATQCAKAEGVSRSAWSDRLDRARKKLRRIATGGAAVGRRLR